MNKYITKSGQNIYDIALTIYGSVEGVFDLLASNDDISLDTVFKKDTVLYYHEDFILNENIVKWLDEHNIIVRNGNHQMSDPSVLKAIKQWIEQSAPQSSPDVTLEEGGNIGDICIAPPNIWFEDDFIDEAEAQTSFTELTGNQAWPDQQIKLDTVSAEWIAYVKDKYRVNTETFNVAEQQRYWNNIFSDGLIVLPTSTNELAAYYINASTPKVKIAQAGRTSAMYMQIPANHFVAIDWGDDSGLEFFHYQSKTVHATHTYSDDSSHTIIMYGSNQFTNLDFSEVCGVYYALTNICIKQQFITPYPDTSVLNKLFITNDHE